MCSVPRDGRDRKPGSIDVEGDLSGNMRVRKKEKEGKENCFSRQEKTSKRGEKSITQKKSKDRKGRKEETPKCR